MKAIKKFIGRRQELQILGELINGREIARLITVKGRRRIGKSRLLMEFGKQFQHCYLFSGLPPERGITADDQRQEFLTQLDRQFGVRGIKSEDWSDLFWHLAQQTKSGKTLIILDEISWMAKGDHTFLPKLKNAWDLYFKGNSKLTLALCSSISSWIEENILNSTGFFGRSSLNLTLNELPLNHCLQFWENSNISNQDKLIMLSITGGVPRYLEEIDPKESAAHNISRLCFNKSGILYSEFDQIFSDLFSQRSELYKKIVVTLETGSREAKDIAATLGTSLSGDIYDYLNDLILAGFISRDYTWHFKNGKLSKLSHYRLKDNYCRFYLKYILSNKEKIIKEEMKINNLSILTGFSSILGLQFENIVLNNRKLIHEALGLSAEEIISDNPYFQRKTNSQRGCQIDYLIQTKYNTLFVCEIKFSTKQINSNVIDEMKEKIKRLSKPRNFSCVPVLIYFGDLSEGIQDSNYFTKLINFEQFM